MRPGTDSAQTPGRKLLLAIVALLAVGGLVAAMLLLRQGPDKQGGLVFTGEATHPSPYSPKASLQQGSFLDTRLVAFLYLTCGGG